MCPILCFMNSSAINYGVLNRAIRKLVRQFKIKSTSCFHPVRMCIQCTVYSILRKVFSSIATEKGKSNSSNNNGNIVDKRVDHDGVRFCGQLRIGDCRLQASCIHIRMWYFIVLIYWRIFQWREALKSNPSHFLHIHTQTHARFYSAYCYWYME